MCSDAERAEDAKTAESVLAGYFLCEWFEDWDTVEADNTARFVLKLLRELPVEQRMEAMGMRRDGPRDLWREAR